MRLFRHGVLSWTLLMVPLGVQAQSVESFNPAGGGLPLFRPPGAVVVIARATAQWIAVPTDPHDLLGDYQFLPSYATDDTEGQLFEILRSEPGWESPDSTRLFVAVPWTVGCGCAEEGWDESDSQLTEHGHTPHADSWLYRCGGPVTAIEMVVETVVNATANITETIVDEL